MRPSRRPVDTSRHASKSALNIGSRTIIFRDLNDPASEASRRSPVMEKDPVCGMLVEPKQAAGQRTVQGKPYYFCSSDCLAKFDKAPQRYLPPAPQGQAPKVASALPTAKKETGCP